jgi:hypothetical protein
MHLQAPLIQNAASSSINQIKCGATVIQKLEVAPSPPPPPALPPPLLPPLPLLPPHFAGPRTHRWLRNHIPNASKPDQCFIYS